MEFLTSDVSESMAGGVSSVVNVLAIENAAEVRDTLSKIDRIRERQAPT
ncbi:MAG: hypothetical protein MI757_13540 [Pirellulales bacterium]|nr:hypothetical protein [Pirellulales bacterium]